MPSTATIQLGITLHTVGDMPVTVGEGTVELQVPISLQLDEGGDVPTVSVDFDSAEMVERIKGALVAFELALALTAPDLTAEVPEKQ